MAGSGSEQMATIKLPSVSFSAKGVRPASDS
jgi:hypothetical protein